MPNVNVDRPTSCGCMTTAMISSIYVVKHPGGKRSLNCHRNIARRLEDNTATYFQCGDAYGKRLLNWTPASQLSSVYTVFATQPCPQIWPMDMRIMWKAPSIEQRTNAIGERSVKRRQMSLAATSGIFFIPRVYR
jgi:hypothetical protein